MSEIRYVPPAAASGPTGSGAAGQVTFWSAATVLTGSNNLFWDNTNGRLGIGTNTPAYKFHNTGNGYFGSTLYFGGNQDYINPSSNNGIFEISSNLPIVFKNNAGTQFGRFVNSTGNFILNSTTDIGAKLGIKGSGSTSSTLSLLIINSSSVKTFQIDDAGNGYTGSTTNAASFTVSGNNISILTINDNLNNKSTSIYKNAENGYIIESYSGNKLAYGYGGNYWMSWRCATKNIAVSSTASDPTPDASSILDLQSTTRGFLVPRMTDTQILAIPSPATGLMAYSTTQNVIAFYDGTAWHKVTHTNL